MSKTKRQIMNRLQTIDEQLDLMDDAFEGSREDINELISILQDEARAYGKLEGEKAMLEQMLKEMSDGNKKQGAGREHREQDSPN